MPTVSVKADYVNLVKKNQVYFSDIPTNFDMAPNSGDLASVTNTDSVTQSLENLVLTFLGERLYQPSVGSSLQFRAFELANEIETELIRNAVMNCAIANEPRVRVVDVAVNFLNDYSYAVAIYYYVINNTKLQQLDVILSRTR